MYRHEKVPAVWKLFFFLIWFFVRWWNYTQYYTGIHLWSFRNDILGGMFSHFSCPYPAVDNSEKQGHPKISWWSLCLWENYCCTGWIKCFPKIHWNYGCIFDLLIKFQAINCVSILSGFMKLVSWYDQCCVCMVQQPEWWIFQYWRTFTPHIIMGLLVP